jgi:hypothetical protein
MSETTGRRRRAPQDAGSRALSGPFRPDDGEASLLRDRAGLPQDRRPRGLHPGRPAGLVAARRAHLDERSQRPGRARRPSGTPPSRRPSARGVGRPKGASREHPGRIAVARRPDRALDPLWPSAGERIIDRRRRLVEFRPGAVFALVRWRAGDYGTVESRIAILRAGVARARPSPPTPMSPRALKSCSISRAGPRSRPSSRRSTRRRVGPQGAGRRARSLAACRRAARCRAVAACL